VSRSERYLNMTLIQRVMQRLMAAVTWRPVLTILIALSVSALSILYTIHGLGFLTSQKDLISPDNRLVKLSEQLDEFEDYDTFVVAIQNQDPARSLQFLHHLVSLLESDREHYVDLFHRVDPKSLEPWALLYLDKKDLLTLQENLEENQILIRNLTRSPNLNSFYKLINEKMTSQMVGELFTGFLDDDVSGAKEDPVDLSFLVSALQSMERFLDNGVYKSPWGSFFSGATWDEDSEGFFWTSNKQYLLMFVTPAKVDNSFNKAQASLEALRAAIAKARQDYPDIEVGVTGQQALNVDEMTLALDGMSLATAISIVGLMLLLILFWRGLRRPSITMIEMLVALSLTFGLTTLVIGHLNILSVVFAPLLLGLGIDYGIHIQTRYHEEVDKGESSRKEAIRTTMVRLGPAILLAGSTASLSFFPLALTGFRGLVELGIICALGMLMSTLNTLCLLPALILVFDKAGARPKATLRELQPLLPLSNRLALFIVILSGMALGVSLVLARNVSFDLNMLHLQSKSAESVNWEMKLLKGSERSSMYGAVLASSLEEVRRKSQALKTLPTVSELHSIDTLLPEDQDEKIRTLKELQTLLPPLQPHQDLAQPVDVAELQNVLAKIGFKMLDSSNTEWGARPPVEDQMIQVRSLIEQLRRRFQSLDEKQVQTALKTFENALMTDLLKKLGTIGEGLRDARPMSMSDLPDGLLRRFSKGSDLYLIRVFPAENIWEPELLGKFVSDLRSVEPDVIGDPITLHAFTKAFRDACIQAAIYAVGFIFVLLMLTFRNVVNAFLAMTPLIVGTAWTLGLMSLFKVDFNLANAVFLPLIVGAGVEYGIIIVQRWNQRSSNDPVLPSSTGTGVILAGLTTTVGFGSLTVASHQGIYSLGLLSTAGSLSVVAAAVVFLPAVLQLLPSLSGKRLSGTEIELPVARRIEETSSLEKE
jgi:uncharacterized protein